MKKRMKFYLISGIISSIISMIIGIVGYIINIDSNISLLASSLLLVGSLVVLIASVLSYLYNDRYGGFMMLGGVLLSGFGSMIGYLEFELWMSLCLIISINAGLLAVVVALYRLKINQNVFDNSIFGTIPHDDLFALILSILTGFIFIIEIVLAFSQGCIISAIVLLTALIFILGGEIISYFGLSRFGSLLVTAGAIDVFLLTNYFELLSYSSTTLFLIVGYVFLSAFIWFEWFGKGEEGIEIQIGPKEYVEDEND